MTEREFWNDAYKVDPEHTVVPDHIVHDEIVSLAPGSALDIGCGTGSNTVALARQGWQVTGIDFAEEAVFLAERAAWKAGVSARFHVGDALHWTETNRYDLVVSTFALPDGGRAIAFLRNACRAVVPGGTILIVEWNTSMAKPWGFRESELFTPTGISAALEGFEIRRQEVVRVERFFTVDDPRADHGLWAEIAVVRAERPTQASR